MLQTIVWGRPTRELCSAGSLEYRRPHNHSEFNLSNLDSSICNRSKVRDYGMVVVSREGTNPEKFIYNSDLLTRYRF